MVIFHSYVKLPEGTRFDRLKIGPLMKIHPKRGEKMTLILKWVC